MIFSIKYFIKTTLESVSVINGSLPHSCGADKILRRQIEQECPEQHWALRRWTASRLLVKGSSNNITSLSYYYNVFHDLTDDRATSCRSFNSNNGRNCAIDDRHKVINYTCKKASGSTWARSLNFYFNRSFDNNTQQHIYGGPVSSTHCSLRRLRLSAFIMFKMENNININNRIQAKCETWTVWHPQSTNVRISGLCVLLEFFFLQ